MTGYEKLPYTREFEVFWRYYPDRWDRSMNKKIKRKKRPAFDKWLLLSDEIRHEILTKVKYIRQFEGAYARDAVTWLNQCGWEDIEFKPAYQPVLPPEMLDVLKPVPDDVDSNQRRTDNLRLLKAKP